MNAIAQVPTTQLDVEEALKAPILFMLSAWFVGAFSKFAIAIRIWAVWGLCSRLERKKSLYFGKYYTCQVKDVCYHTPPVKDSKMGRLP